RFHAPAAQLFGGADGARGRVPDGLAAVLVWRPRRHTHNRRHEHLAAGRLRATELILTFAAERRVDGLSAPGRWFGFGVNGGPGGGLLIRCGWKSGAMRHRPLRWLTEWGGLRVSARERAVSALSGTSHAGKVYTEAELRRSRPSA